MTVVTREKALHRSFLISVWIKGLAGLVETMGGILVLFITPRVLDSFVILLTAPELAEDPDDKVANYLSQAAQHFSTDSQLFASAYLIIHGLIKLL